MPLCARDSLCPWGGQRSAPLRAKHAEGIASVHHVHLEHHAPLLRLGRAGRPRWESQRAPGALGFGACGPCAATLSPRSCWSQWTTLAPAHRIKQKQRTFCLEGGGNERETEIFTKVSLGRYGHYTQTNTGCAAGALQPNTINTVLEYDGKAYDEGTETLVGQLWGGVPSKTVRLAKLSGNGFAGTCTMQASCSNLSNSSNNDGPVEGFLSYCFVVLIDGDIGRTGSHIE